MRHARQDYNRIQDPAGLIPRDEPVFLLRGQDITAPAVVRRWATLAKREGASDEIVGAALAQADEMEKWQDAQGSKTPDIPANWRETSQPAPSSPQSVFFQYTNHRGVTEQREVVPIAFEFLPHPGLGYDPGFFFRAFDPSRNAERSFSPARMVGDAGFPRLVFAETLSKQSSSELSSRAAAILKLDDDELRQLAIRPQDQNMASHQYVGDFEPRLTTEFCDLVRSLAGSVLSQDETKGQA